MWVVAGGVLFRLALSWRPGNVGSPRSIRWGRASNAANLVTSGRLEASDGASIHRCQHGNVGFPRSIRWLASIATHLVTQGFLDASNGASIHRCHKHVLSTSRNASWANEFEPFSGCSHLLILILHSLSGLLCRLLRRGLKPTLPQCSPKRKKAANSEMSPLIAAHVFSWAWRYNPGIKSADAFARDLAGIL